MQGSDDRLAGFPAGEPLLDVGVALEGVCSPPLATRNYQTYNTNMKPIQVMFDEELLDELDADLVVREKGRSAVLRQAAAEYLEKRKREDIAAAYARAYASTGEPDDELEGWEDEGEWPKD